MVGRLALWSLRRRGLIRTDAGRDGGVALTERGREAAARVVRSHRLWESYLTHELGLPADHVHDPSHRMEHFISRDVEHGIASEMGTEEDPHGKRIPPRDA